MSVRVRLTRVGSKKNPVWRVVVADQRSPRDGRIIESLGHYNPQTEPSTIVIDRERLDHWLGKGAQPSNTIRKLMRAPNTDPAPDKPPNVPDPGTPAAEKAGAPAASGTEPDAGAEPDSGTEPEPEAGAGTADTDASGQPDAGAGTADADASDQPEG